MADQNEQENLEAQRQVTEAAAELQRSLRAATAELLAMGRVTDKTSAEVAKAQSALARSGGDSAKILKAAFDKASESGLNLEDALKQAATAARGWQRMVGDALETLAQAAIGTAITLQRGNKGLTAYDGQIQQLSGAVKGVLGPLQAMGPGLGNFGKALGVGADAATALALAATDMGDKLYTSFGALNRAGGAAADGMTGLFNDAKNLGLSMNELSALTDAVGSRAQDFALFGGSVADARKRLGQMGDQLRDNREQFLSLGMTMPEVTEGLANYVALQSRLGRGQSQSTAQMAESARKYLLEQDALTKLLGVTREQQEQAQQRALNHEQFLARVRMEEARGNTGVAKRLLELNKMYAAAGPQAEASFQAIVAGNLANEDAVRGLITSQGEMMRSTEAVIAGQMEPLQAFQATGQAVGEYSKSVGQVTALMNTNKDIALSLAEQDRLRIMTSKDLTEAEKKIKLEQLAMGADGAKAQDPLLAAQAKLVGTQIRANDALDQLVKNVLPVVQSGMQELTNGALAAARALGKLGDEKPARAEDQRVIEENTKALESMQGELGQAEAAYEKAMQGATVLQKMGIGRTDEQQAAFDRRKELRERESALQRGIATAESGTRGADTGGGMGMPGEAPVPEAAPGGAAPTSAAGAAPAAGPRGFTEEDLVRRGLKIKAGATQKEGGVIQPNAVDLAEQVQQQIAGFSRITGFNDGHMRSATSKHQQGRAFDFTVEPSPSREEGARIVGQLKGMGASYAQDEYHNRSDNATGPHFHVEVPAMAKGGITQGVSIAGEAGPEAVVPLPDGKSIPVQMPDFGYGDLAVSIDGLNERIREMTGASEIRLRGNPMETGGVGPTAFGYNAWTGINAGGMTTDLNAIKDIAGQLGAFDRATQTITNPETWQRILQSGIGTNVEVGGIDLGTRLGGADIGVDIGERIKEIMATKDTDLKEAMKEVTKEFNAVMAQVFDTIKGQQDPQIQTQILETLVSISRNQSRTADASQRMADVAMN